jgi:hypothetical protein
MICEDWCQEFGLLVKVCSRILVEPKILLIENKRFFQNFYKLHNLYILMDFYFVLSTVTAVL